ncbi:MAG: hypothetical protein ACI9XO_004302 [Paraglaciecola sp.]|jgi:hypothetical protein
MKKLLLFIFSTLLLNTLFAQSSASSEIAQKNDFILSKEVYFDFGQSDIRTRANASK